MYRHTHPLHQLGKALELEAHDRSADVVGMVVGDQHTRQVHTVGLQRVHQISCGVRRVHHDGVAGLAVAHLAARGGLKRAPTSRWALATCPADGSRLLVARSPRPVPFGATAMPAAAFEAVGRRRQLRATAAFKAGTLRRLDPATLGADGGYGFQIEAVWRVTRQGGAVTEVPICFQDRVHGESKMSKAIVLEAMRLVTQWGAIERWEKGGLRLGLSGAPPPPRCWVTS